MKYINVNTGKIVDVPSELGGSWKPVEEEKKPAKKASKKPKKGE